MQFSCLRACCAMSTAALAYNTDFKVSSIQAAAQRSGLAHAHSAFKLHMSLE
jgi:hypothetical protein